MVKDLRTNVETGNAQGVLDGDLDRFLEASLADRLGGSDEAALEPTRTRAGLIQLVACTGAAMSLAALSPNY